MSLSTHPTAEDVYEEYREEVDDLADRDDEIGALMRALRQVAGDADE